MLVTRSFDHHLDNHRVIARPRYDDRNVGLPHRLKIPLMPSADISGHKSDWPSARNTLSSLCSDFIRSASATMSDDELTSKPSDIAKGSASCVVLLRPFENTASIFAWRRTSAHTSARTSHSAGIGGSGSVGGMSRTSVTNRASCAPATVANGTSTIAKTNTNRVIRPRPSRSSDLGCSFQRDNRVDPKQYRHFQANEPGGQSNGPQSGTGVTSDFSGKHLDVAGPALVGLGSKRSIAATRRIFIVQTTALRTNQPLLMQRKQPHRVGFVTQWIGAAPRFLQSSHSTPDSLVKWLRLAQDRPSSFQHTEDFREQFFFRNYVWTVQIHLPGRCARLATGALDVAHHEAIVIAQGSV